MNTDVNANDTPRDIRTLGYSELSSVLQLYAHLHRGDEPLPEPGVVESVWSEFLASPHFFCYGGYEENRLVSSCTLVIVPNLTRGCRPYALIENVVTHADCRNKGWGRAILEHAMEQAWSRRCYKTLLMTGRKDEAIIRFYESAGFDRNDKQAYVARPHAG